jgi:hypothetical protein
LLFEYAEATEERLAARLGGRDPDKIRNSLQKLETRRERYADLFAEDAISREAYDARMSKIGNEERELRSALASLEEVEESRARLARAVAVFVRGGVELNTMDEYEPLTTWLQERQVISQYGNLAGQTIHEPARDESAPIGSIRWVTDLRRAANAALQPGAWGRTPPLADWAQEELRRFAEVFGVQVILRRRDDASTLPAWLQESKANPAEWPEVIVGEDLIGLPERSSFYGTRREQSGESSGAPRFRPSSPSSFRS